MYGNDVSLKIDEDKKPLLFLPRTFCLLFTLHHLLFQSIPCVFTTIYFTIDDTPCNRIPGSVSWSFYSLRKNICVNNSHVTVVLYCPQCLQFFRHCWQQLYKPAANKLFCVSFVEKRKYFRTDVVWKNGCLHVFICSLVVKYLPNYFQNKRYLLLKYADNSRKTTSEIKGPKKLKFSYFNIF